MLHRDNANATNVKNLWQKAFKNQDPDLGPTQTDIFETIWQNQSLREDLFPELPPSPSPQQKIQYLNNQFKNLTESTNSKLYNFIKSE